MTDGADRPSDRDASIYAGDLLGNFRVGACANATPGGSESRTPRPARSDGYLLTGCLADLRTWIENNPNDPLVDRARSQHNECVEVLQETDRQFYDWFESEIERLDRV